MPRKHVIIATSTPSVIKSLIRLPIGLVSGNVIVEAYGSDAGSSYPQTSIPLLGGQIGTTATVCSSSLFSSGGGGGSARCSAAGCNGQTGTSTRGGGGGGGYYCVSCNCYFGQSGGPGGLGVIRIVWGTVGGSPRQFPNTNISTTST